ncbi:unnamed protein product [Malus baccata var. baccata]
MKGKAWTRKEDDALCKAYRWVSEDSVRGNCQTNDAASRHESGANYYDEVRQAEELYMESSSKPFQFHSCWEICKVWVLFEDPPNRASTPVFETASLVADMDEDESPTIQQTRLENLSSIEGFILSAMGRNKARRLKEKGKVNGDCAAQHELAASL